MIRPLWKEEALKSLKCLVSNNANFCLFVLFLKINFGSQASWHTPAIPALGRWRQNDVKLESSLFYMETLYQEEKKNVFL
jgi:hypothetical protein